MAVVCPWPSTPAALAAARQCVRVGVGLEGTAGFVEQRGDDEIVVPPNEEARISNSRLDMLAETACEIVQRYAPEAPQPIKREALFRLVGYLHGSDYGGFVSETLGPQSFTHASTNADFARRSGALALLSPYRIRRAGAAG